MKYFFHPPDKFCANLIVREIDYDAELLFGSNVHKINKRVETILILSKIPLSLRKLLRQNGIFHIIYYNLEFGINIFVCTFILFEKEPIHSYFSPSCHE